MTTFELTEVRNFAADLDARMERCDNGEGMECATLDATLRHYADLCCKFREGVRQWGREVFAGRVVFDPAVEQVWRTEGVRLFARADEMLAYGYEAEVPCYVLDGAAVLGAALLDLHVLLDYWVTPELAVGPAARHQTPSDPTTAEQARVRLGSLPPLPAGWQPAGRQQRRVFRKLKPS